HTAEHSCEGSQRLVPLSPVEDPVVERSPLQRSDLLVERLPLSVGIVGNLGKPFEFTEVGRRSEAFDDRVDRGSPLEARKEGVATLREIGSFRRGQVLYPAHTFGDV